MKWTPLPIGVENYEEIIEKGYYYVDKTLLIKDLIDLRGKVLKNLMMTGRTCFPERKSWLPVQNIQKNWDSTL